MNKKQKTLIMAALWASAFTLTAGAGELLTNPNFEDAIDGSDGMGWERRGGKFLKVERVMKGAIQGAFALQVSGRSGQKWEGVKQVLSLEAGKTYSVSGLMKLSEGEGSDTGVVQLVTIFQDGTKEYQDLWRGEVTDSGYVSFQNDFVVKNSDVEEMSLAIHGPEGGKSFMIDNFSLIERK